MAFALRTCGKCRTASAFSRAQLENPADLRCPRCGATKLLGNEMPTETPPPKEGWRWHKERGRKTSAGRRRVCEECSTEVRLSRAELASAFRPRCPRCGSTRLLRPTRTQSEGTSSRRRGRYPHELVTDRVRQLAESSSLAPPPDDMRTVDVTRKARAAYTGPRRYELSNLLSEASYWSPDGIRECAHRLFRRRKLAPSKAGKRRTECLGMIRNTGQRLLRLATRLERRGILFPVDLGPVLRSDGPWRFEFVDELRRCLKKLNDVERLLRYPDAKSTRQIDGARRVKNGSHKRHDATGCQASVASYMQPTNL